VLEYVDDVDATLREIARVVRAGGVVIATVPDPAHPLRRVEALLRLLVPPPSLRARLPGPLRRYAAYLDVSRNRPPLERWHERARRHGFAAGAAPRPLRAHRRWEDGALVVLSLRRA
jgi:hypothetical protein